MQANLLIFPGLEKEKRREDSMYRGKELSTTTRDRRENRGRERKEMKREETRVEKGEGR